MRHLTEFHSAQNDPAYYLIANEFGTLRHCQLEPISYLVQVGSADAGVATTNWKVAILRCKQLIGESSKDPLSPHDSSACLESRYFVHPVFVRAP